MSTNEANSSDLALRNLEGLLPDFRQELQTLIDEFGNELAS